MRRNIHAVLCMQCYAISKVILWQLHRDCNLAIERSASIAVFVTTLLLSINGTIPYLYTSCVLACFTLTQQQQASTPLGYLPHHLETHCRHRNRNRNRNRNHIQSYFITYQSHTTNRCCYRYRYCSRTTILTHT